MHDDDIDPIAEIRAIREKNGRKYKTMEAYFGHLRTLPPVEVLLARVQAKIERAKAKEAKPGKRPAPRRRRAPAHA